MSELFRGLGGLMKGLSSMIPQNEGATQLHKLRREIEEMEKSADALYTQIGKQAVEQYGAEGFGEAGAELTRIQAEVQTLQQQLEEAERAEEERKHAESAAASGKTCPACGHNNPERTQFCQECGSKLAAQNGCPSCGASIAPGVKFCPACGTRVQQEASVICPDCGEKNPPSTRFCGACGASLAEG